MVNEIGKWSYWSCNERYLFGSWRINLLKALRSWKIRKNNKSLYIPKWKFSAPNKIFAETDESFRKIVSKHPYKIIELNKIQDIDEFIRQSFEYIKWEMWIDDEWLRLKIINKESVDNWEDNLYSMETNQVTISKDRAWHTLKHIKWKWDRAEIFGAIVHELNHYLQNKEIVLSIEDFRDACICILDWWTPKIQKEIINEKSWKKVKILIDMPNAMKDMIVNSYMRYEDNFDGELYLKKAQKYKDNFDHYIEPIKDENQIVINYSEYKWQFVEDESFRRWDMVTEEYRKVIEME